MSILEKVSAALAGKPKPLTVAEIAERISDTRGKIHQLENEYHRLATAWADGLATAAERDQTADALATGNRDLAALEVAHKAALERAAAEERAKYASLRASQIHSVTMHLRAREKAAADMVGHIELAVSAWRKMMKASGKAKAACPQGSNWPQLDALCEFSELQRLTEQTLFRVGADGALHGQTNFPGANAHDIRLLNNPAAVPDIVRVLTERDDFIIDKFKKEQGTTAKPVPVVADASVEEQSAPSAIEPGDIKPFTGSIHDLPPPKKISIDTRKAK